MSEEKLVRVYSGEHLAFWRQNGCGYTTEIEAAGVFTEEDAIA